MPSPPPYMPSSANLSKILTRMREAGAPPRFTHDFLKSTLGFSSSNDRAVIGVLKQLGFLSADGTPSPRYHQFRSESLGGIALADGLREGWAEIFLADQRANEKTAGQLTEIFKTSTGKSESVAAKMATTFKTLSDQADWRKGPPSSRPDTSTETAADETPGKPRAMERKSTISLNHDLHVHLPPTSDVAVYKAIFRALREELLD